MRHLVTSFIGERTVPLIKNISQTENNSIPERESERTSQSNKKHINQRGSGMEKEGNRRKEKREKKDVTEKIAANGSAPRHV